ncbi:MAG: polyhydroxyalkanoate synthesis regulator DNA-binding domain-containing protein [Myxococcota bacterium]|jgi:polyhydroxyalkanoate synthesis repressor PhaR|nr:polyhydroxyalkanoate synthesis regulator DNA-binding domain-containing protein [Myxococcota bacterium]
MPILIKRYANRKLYNTASSRYITLKGISELLDEGEEVRVIDNETGEDITSVALSQILVDSTRSKGDPSPSLLSQIMERGGDVLYDVLKKGVDDATDNFDEIQDRFRRIIGSDGEQKRSTDRRRDYDDPYDDDDDEEEEDYERDTERADPSRSPFAARARGTRERGSAESDRSSSARRRTETTRRGARDRRGLGDWIAYASPDFDSAIQNAVERVFKVLDLPRRKDVDALNENLERVAQALEELQNALAPDESGAVDGAVDEEPVETHE